MSSVSNFMLFPLEEFFEDFEHKKTIWNDIYHLIFVEREREGWGRRQQQSIKKKEIWTMQV